MGVFSSAGCRTSAECGARAPLLHQSNDDLSLAGLTADHLVAIHLDLDSSPLPFSLALGRVLILSRTRTYGSKKSRDQQEQRSRIRQGFPSKIDPNCFTNSLGQTFSTSSSRILQLGLSAL